MCFKVLQGVARKVEKCVFTLPPFALNIDCEKSIAWYNKVSSADYMQIQMGKCNNLFEMPDYKRQNWCKYSNLPT